MVRAKWLVCGPRRQGAEKIKLKQNLIHERAPSSGNDKSCTNLLFNLHEGLSINHNQPRAKQSARHQQPSSQLIPLHRLNETNKLRFKTTSGHQSKISPRSGHSQLKLTDTKMRSKPALCSNKWALSFVSIIFICLMLANKILSSNCDTSPQEVQFSPQKSYQATIQQRRLDAGSGSVSAARATPLSHKERMLMSLSDNIERQHVMSSAGIRSLKLSRPSKFDSGSENLEYAATSLEGVRAQTDSSNQPPPRQYLRTMDDIMKQHHGRGSTGAPSKESKLQFASVSSSPAGIKADQELRQIMMLHEQAVSSRAQSTGKTAPTSKPFDHSKKSRFETHLTRYKTPTSTKPPSNKTNSFWSLATRPILADKLLSNGIIKFAPSTSSRFQSAHNLTHLFTPRTHAKTSSVANPLIGLSQMFASPEASQRMSSKNGGPVEGTSSAEYQASYVLSNAINQPQGYNNNLKGLVKGRKSQNEDNQNKNADLEGSSQVSGSTESAPDKLSASALAKPTRVGGLGAWIKNGANQLAQSHLQDSFRDLLTLTQLPILSGGPISTAPSELEPGGRKYMTNMISNQQVKVNKTQTIDDIFRYAYILGNLAVRRKRDPLKALSSSANPNQLILASSSGSNKEPLFSLRGLLGNHRPTQTSLVRLPSMHLNSLHSDREIKPRGVMWDMATDPSLAVTVFHLLERASVALPLGFLLMPIVHMIRNPLYGINLGRIIPARASHRSVDYEELARKIDMMDRILSRALRSSHRESSTFIKRRR